MCPDYLGTSIDPNAQGHDKPRHCSPARTFARCVDYFPRNPNGYRSAPIPCRPSVISSQNRRRISRMVSNSTWSVNQVRAETGLSGSRTTIWRCIRSNEHICRQTMQKAPHLTNFRKQARLEFARKNMARNGKM
ncbi:unnamed protein product [Heligmosomoides polygyrus]|uniref:HTH_Tnp_Tc3_2 domain-containing protein n=1 Tax=Heligmosomoides polygyrus TaxID=6339 RepID=A0A183FPV2_HELPZ|nr:unnamed protein product [Heligmosomoides polygyrus]